MTAPHPADAGPGPCLPPLGITVTCTGDQSDGIASGVDFLAPPTSTLNVNNLTEDIAPATGTAGIYFSSLGNVTINSDTTDGPGGPFEITTNGAFAYGIDTFSILGNINVTHTGDITTDGFNAYGIDAFALNQSATVSHTGNIITRDDDSRGISAAGETGATVNQTGNVTTQGNGSRALYAGTGVGTASITQTGNIETQGIGSEGIFAISVTGPGVEVNQTGSITTQQDFSAGIVGLSGGGSVTVSQTGNISTSGFDSYGIFIEALTTASVTQTGDITTEGSFAYAIYANSVTGPINVTQSGNIRTSGNDADGIYAYSDFGGAITIEKTGDITTTGPDSDGIDVDNPNGAGSSEVTINPGSTITGGTGTGDGIDFDGGITNRLFNFGTITTLGENAVEGEGSGAELIDNYGTITGNVDLGPGANDFDNKAGGVFNSGATAFIGAGNAFTNRGTFAPGGSGPVQTTALTGNLAQTGSGVFAVDLDLTTLTNDRLNVTGTANLAGNVEVDVVNPTALTQQFTILSAAGGTTNNGLGLLASPALNATLLFPNATDVVLGISIDLSPAGLNRNQTNLGDNLNAALNAGGGALGPVLDALLNDVFTIQDYRRALDQLLPEIYLNTETATLFFAEEFTNNMLSCASAGEGFSAISEGQCLWARYEGRWLDRDGTFQNIGFDEDIHGISGGGQVALAPNWFVGIAAGYEDASLDTDSGARSDSDRYAIGGVVKYQSGPVMLALAGSAGKGEFDTRRAIDIGGFQATPGSEHDVDYLAGMFRAAYLLDRGAWYAKPFVDVNITHVDREAVRETGGGAANLNVSGGDETYYSVTPSLELGRDIDRGDGRIIRPFVRAGVTVYNDTDQALFASFAGAPAAAGGFTTTSEFDDVFADIEAGVMLFHGQEAAYSVTYEGRLSDDTQQHGFFVKGTRTF